MEISRMWFKVVVIVVFVVACGQLGDGQADGGYRIARQASFFIAAPQKIHPNQVVQASVSILKMYYEHINVRLIIRRQEEELAQAYTTFLTEGTQLMQLKVPENADEGNYTLRVEGTTNGEIGGYIFENETKLVYERKQISVFIQLNKPLFRQGQLLKFRIMPVEKNLMSRSGSMDIYIEDSTGTIVRRWLSMQTNAGGVLEMDFQISWQPHFGEWKLKVNSFGAWYEKPFNVDEFSPSYFGNRGVNQKRGRVTAIDVNVSMPLHLTENDFGLAGMIWANLSLGQPAKGTCKVKCEVRDPLLERDPNRTDWPTLEQEVRYFPGVIDFMFLMEDLAALVGGKIGNKEVYVEALVYDWFLVQEATGGATTVIYEDLVEVKVLGDTARAIKPGQTIELQMAVMSKDGSPITTHRRQMTITGSERSLSGSTRDINSYILVGDDGIGRFRYTSRDDVEMLRMQAAYDESVAISEEVTWYRHYSPTQSYITITTSTDTPMVDMYMVFTVRTNTLTEKVQYVVTAGGNIVTGGAVEMYTNQKTFSMALSRDMIPEAHMIVWFVYDDEVISDSLNFFVNGTRINPISARFNRGKDFTGDMVELTSFSDPSSYIGFNGIDHELWSYGWNPFITEVDIIEELRTFDSHVNSSNSHIWKMAEEQLEMTTFPAPSYAIDANTTFEYAGLLVFTDANVTRVPNMCNETLGTYPCMDGTCFALDQWCDGARQCIDGQDEMGCPKTVYDPFTPPRNRLGLLTRHYLETGDWMWGGHFLMPNGRLDMIKEVPDEPMAWVMAAFAISKDLGFGVIHNPPRHQGTRPFYMRAEAPELMVRGEQVGVRVGLFNYWDQDLECILMLHNSDDFKFVIVEEFGIVSSYNPRLLSGDVQTMVYLEKGRVYELQMPILPQVDGCITVTVTASAFIYGDTEQLEICTKYDGVTNYLQTPYLIDLISSGSQVLPDLEIPVPERFIKPGERQHLYVPGSPVATVGIVGDIVGPGFHDEFLNAENTLNKPFGSAEQSMYNFAFNLYNLLYQKATNQLDNDVLITTIEHLNIALQRQMSYMNEDGSISQFRDYQQHTPSTWVSAFVLQTLNEANEKDWEYRFYIPIELLNKIALWLCDQRDGHSGAFIENAPIYDRKLWGNKTYNDHKYGYKIGLTAHVLIAFAKSDRLTGVASQCRMAVIQESMKYLEDLVQELKDPYEISITTYALHLVGSNEATSAFNKLDSIKIETEYVYWADKEVPPNDIRRVDNIPYHQPRRWYDNEAYAVETTSYALLTFLLKNYYMDSKPIMKWLQTMRNTFYAQASTHDSIIALEALVEYAKKDTNRALYNIEVTVQATSMGNFSEDVRLDSSNWAVMQTVDIFPVWGSVRGRAQGTGMAIMQLRTEVNVEYPYLIMPEAEDHFFNVSINEMLFTGKNFSIFEATVCARWSRPDISERSGMAVIEMHLPTGYIITNDVLRGYAQSGEVPTLRRAEMYERKIQFYFDYLESQETCVRFRTDRWFPVANMTIQHLLRVFDYYEPGMHNTTLYNTWYLFNLHMCQVCGSFQCPYCRFYNVASTIHISLLLSLGTVMFGLLIKNWVTVLPGT